MFQGKTEDWKELLLKDFRLKITAFSETGDLTFLNETKTENVYSKIEQTQKETYLCSYVNKYFLKVNINDNTEQLHLTLS